MTDLAYYDAIQEYSRQTRTIADAWNSRRVDELLSCITEDVFWDDPVMEKPARGHEAVKNFALSLWRAIPDFKNRFHNKPLNAHLLGHAFIHLFTESSTYDDGYIRPSKYQVNDQRGYL